MWILLERAAECREYQTSGNPPAPVTQIHLFVHTAGIFPAAIAYIPCGAYLECLYNSVTLGADDAPLWLGEHTAH